MDTHFQVIIFGTGLTESITAAALAKAGLKVAHIDSNQYYGAEEASLTATELQQCIDTVSGARNSNARLTSASLRGEFPSSSRAYSLSLSPSIIPSRGSLISSLIGSGVAHYGGFKLLEFISVYSADGFKSVPGSKEHIFKSKELSLMDKRRLMRFLMYASGDFETSPEVQGRESMTFVSFVEDVFSISKQLASALAYALALCKTSSDPVLPALNRIKRYLQSAGRYGPSPFLVGQYGGLGELAQGFCRVCAVAGGTYILGRDILSLDAEQRPSSETRDWKNFRLKLSDIPENLTADIIVSSAHFLPKFGIAEETKHMDGLTDENHAYSIAIIDSVLSRPSSSESVSSMEDSNEDEDITDSGSQSRPIDAALFVFPPGELSSGNALGPVNVLVNGEGTLSCPRGKSILYLSTIIEGNTVDKEALDPELLLRPYLETTLSLLRTPDATPPKELCSVFYRRTSRSISQTRLASLKEKGILISPALPDHLAEAGDASAANGEALFRDVLKQLGKPDAYDIDFWPPLPPGLDDDEDVL